MPEPDSALLLRAGSSSHHVSLVSSLLRTFQAAVRDIAQATATGRKMLAAQPPPVLEVDVVAPGGGPMTMTFRFTGAGHETLHELNSVAFGAFVAGLAAALKITPQRTLWGTPVRPLVRSAAENERLKLFLEDLVRLGDVTIAAGGRKIVITEGRIEAAEG